MNEPPPQEDAKRRWWRPYATRGIAFYFLFVASLFVVAARRQPWAVEHEFAKAFLPSTVNCVTPFSQDGDFVLTTGLDRTVRVWDVETGERVAVLRGHITTGVRCASFSPDGTRIITTCGDGARVWDTKTGEQISMLKGPIWHAAFSPNGRFVGCEATITPQDPQTFEVYVWEAATGNVLHVLKGHRGDIKHPSFSPEGRFLLTGSNQGMVRLWDVKTGRLVWGLHEEKVSLNGVGVSFDGSRAFAVFDDFVYVLDMESGAKLLELYAHGRHTRIADFSGAGDRIVTAHFDGTARIWDAQTGALLSTLEKHRGMLSSARFSPDGTRVVTAAMDDGTVRIWDATSGRQLCIFVGQGRAAEPGAFFGPKGKRLVTGCDPVRIWRRRRPEWWWGHFYRVEVWAAIIFGALWLWSVARWFFKRRRGA